ncbi:MAG TPA: hypothetical protein VI911_10490 [Patescibacteria group bacterium]|nr:hypothetical protein [Patescibacteria group bacterium]
MDLTNDDVVPDIGTRTMFQMRLKFEDNTILGPTDIFDQVQKLVKDNLKEIRPKVGRLGDLFVGHGGNGSSLFFTFGWYFRKAVEKLEQQHGTCQVQFDSDTITKEQMQSYIVKYLKKQAEKIGEMAETVMREGLPEELLEDND